MAARLILTRLAEAARAIAPLVAVVCLLEIAVVGAPAELLVQFLLGSVFVSVGMALLFAGVDMGILPMGRFIGAELPSRGSMSLIVAVVFALGCATTLAEPDVLVLASQVEMESRGAVSGQFLAWVIAGGVGIFATLAILRIVSGVSLPTLIAGVYACMLLLSLAAPARFVPLAYDAGSVTTGVLTAPVVLALALGFNSVLAERSAVADGFGLLGIASVGPVITVLLLGMVL